MPIIEIRMAEESEIAILKSAKKWVKTHGLVDLQVNGFGGVDFNTPGITQNSLEHALEAMLASGVTTCLPTIITASETHLQSCLADLETARNFSALAKSMIAGYHLEGPFLSTIPGFSGCHPVQEIGAINPEMFSRLQDSAGGNIRLLTLAPEVDGALAFIDKLVLDGIIVALGHTAAGVDKIREAVKAGASLSTHLGNGTSSELLKNDNPIIAQLGEDQLNASFIADGYHLSPEILKVYLRAKCSKRVVLITDATAGASAVPGSYRLGALELLLGSDPVIYDQQTSRPVGSAVTLDQCVRNVMRWYGISLEEAINWAAVNPQKILSTSQATKFLAESERHVWWKEEKDGWIVKAAQSGNFFYTA
jgi:N-acetylglucosamine-6-phosphate deacetylase